MNRAEFVKKVAENTGCTQKDTNAILNAMQDVIHDTVASGEKITLTGFLAFEKKHIEEKQGTSHVSGTAKAWKTPAKDVVTVKLSKGYKEL